MKRLLILFVCLVWALCLCACGAAGEAPQKPTTPTPTAAPTPAPTPAPTEPPAPKPMVETVIDYTREIEKGGATSLTHHYVRCPALTADTDGAKAINKEIYDTCAKAVTTLENRQEGEYIYLLDYEALQYEDYVVIVMDLTVGERYGGIFGLYVAYYYDAQSGKQLTYEQYRDALGIQESKVREAIDRSGVASAIDYTIVWVAADADQTQILAKSPDFFDGESLIILDESILN